MKARPNFSNASRMILSLIVIVSYLTFTVMLPIEGSATSRRSNDARRKVARGGSSVDEYRAEQSSGTQFKRLPLRFDLNVGQTTCDSVVLYRSLAID